MSRVRTVRAVADYVPIYREPIRLQAGEPISVGREDDEFPGWRWCRSRDGREGWVPIELIDASGESPRIIEPYSARELAVRAGEQLSVEQARHEWLLVTNANGERGWIPASHVEHVS